MWENISNVHFIDGRKRNLQKRSYCLNCSPFGTHNTAQIHKLSTCKTRDCRECGEKFVAERQAVCAACNYKIRCAKRLQKVLQITGTACWHCKYDKGLRGKAVLDFHHIDPKSKSFSLTSREIAVFGWKRIFQELQKCSMLCCRCHREFHCGI